MRFLTKNIALKITALILAFFFWFNVVTNKTYEYDFEVNFMLEAIPQELILTTPPPDKISAKIEGTGKQLLAFIFKNPTLIYNAANFERGIYRIDLTPADLMFDDNIRATVAGINEPQSLTLKFEGMEQKRLPISPEIAVTPALGYALSGDLQIIPDSLDISGPRRIVRALKSIPTESIHFENIKRDVVEKIRLVADDTLFLSMEFDQVEVSQKIVPLTEKKIGPLAIETFNADLFDSVTMQPESLYVIIEGPKDFIDTLNSSVFSVSVNFRNVEPGTSSILPKVVVPSGYRLVGTEPSAISITAVKP